MANKKPLPPDSLVDYSQEGVPIAKQNESEALPNSETPNSNENQSGFTGGAHNKKRQGTEDAQKRSDTGTGL